MNIIHARKMLWMLETLKCYEKVIKDCESGFVYITQSEYDSAVRKVTELKLITGRTT